MTAIASAFQANALIDRMYYVSSTKFVMTNTVQYIHQGFAHQYPLIADDLAEPLLEFNEDVYRPAVLEDSAQYGSIVEMFAKLLEYVTKVNQDICFAYSTAMTNGDISVASKLLDVVNKHKGYVSQAILLNDKAQQYAEDIKGFDRDIGLFWTVAGLIVSAL